jgi:type IV pilus biogenesis protein CpaD/CtpE
MEAKLAAGGYTISIANRAVLGRFRDNYFMRSGDRRLTLPAEKTSLEQLIDHWSNFRRQAVLGNFPTGAAFRKSADAVARQDPESDERPGAGLPAAVSARLTLR